MNDALALAAATALLAQTASYHNHKEQMAYLGAAAYIGAAATLVFSKPLPLHWAGAGVLIVTAIAGLLYVAWQLERRYAAARSVRELYNIIVSSLPAPARGALVAPVPSTLLPTAAMIIVTSLWAAWAFYVIVQLARM